MGNGTSERMDSAQGLTSSLAENIETLQALFSTESDFMIRTFTMPFSGGIQAAIVFFDGMVNTELINGYILNPLMIESRKFEQHFKVNSIEDICSVFLPSGEIKVTDDLTTAASACLLGDSILMVDGHSQCVCINTKGFEKRSVVEPQTETVVRGPREGFTEVLRVNTSLLRRKIKNPHLKMEMMEIGQRTNTSVCLVYLDNIANPELVAEVKKRLATIDTDAILNSGYIEEYIQDAPYSLFQTMAYTEKPDVVASKLLEGRCALIIDGTPFVLTMPMLFIENFHTPEDFAIQPYMAVFLRVLRVIAFFIGMVAPALYVALTMFHQELIPTTLLFTIAASSEDIPFNSIVETAIMLLTFEIIKEAGVRLPKPIGQAVSIVGALVMGQAAIEAGIVGAPVVIAIAFTAVATFLVPGASDVISILRWYLLILTSIMGGFGIVLGLITILFHVASLDSFGSVYLYPFSPFNKTDMKDGILREQIWKMRTRPGVFKPLDRVRQSGKRPRFGRGGDRT